ncbi:hypothetical protein WDU94_001191 [Cyamophila willieti]
MESMQTAPPKQALVRGLVESHAFGHREHIESVVPDVHVSEPEVADQFDDISSSCGRSVTNEASDNLDMETAIGLRKLQIKTGLQNMNLSMDDAIKRRDELRASIAKKKEELRENNERTAEIRRKNEEISLMIQAEDRDTAAFYENLKKESDTLKFFETQVNSGREWIQKSKREMNRNRMMEAENKKLMAAGTEEIKQMKEGIDALVKAKEDECRVLENNLKAKGDPAKIYATLLSLREQLAAQRQLMEETDSTHAALKAQRKQAQEEYRQTKEKYEERVSYKRSLEEEHEKIMKSYQKELERKDSILKDLESQRSHKKQIVALETDHMNQLKKTLSRVEMDRNKMRESSKTFEEKYAKLKEDVAQLKLREEEVNEQVDNKTNELNQAKANLHHRQAVVEQKQKELEQRKTKVAVLKQTLVEKNARKEELERAIIEKKTMADAKLAHTLKQMDDNCERELKTMDDQFAESKAIIEQKIESAQQNIAKTKEEHELFVLNHVTAIEQHTAETAQWIEKRNAAQKQLAEYQQTKALLQEKQKTQQEFYEQQLELKRIELEEKKKEVKRDEERRRKEMEEIQTKLVEAETRRAEAVEKCKGVFKEKEETQSCLNQLIDQVEQLKLIGNAQEEKITMLRRQIEEEETEQENAHSQMEAFKSEIEQTSKRCTILTACILEVTNENDQLLEQINQQQAKLDQMDEEKEKYQSEINQLDETAEAIKQRHEREEQDWCEKHKVIMGELTTKKEMMRSKFRAQYEKLTIEYENTVKANNESTDELLTLRSERENKVVSLQALMKEKENLDKEYKKYQEKMAKMHKLIANMDKAK